MINKKLWSKVIVDKTEKWFCIDNKDTNEDEVIYDPINFLFWITVSLWWLKYQKQWLKIYKNTKYHYSHDFKKTKNYRWMHKQPNR